MFDARPFVARTLRFTMVATVCRFEDDRGTLLGHARITDRGYRTPQVLTADAQGSRPLLRIHRPSENFTLQVIHEGIPGTDNLYMIHDLERDEPVGVIQKPWLKGVWTSRWIARDGDWNEIAIIEEASLARALFKTFIIPPFPSPYVLRQRGRVVGSVDCAWEFARRRFRLTLDDAASATVDRRLCAALLTLMLTL